MPELIKFVQSSVADTYTNLLIGLVIRLQSWKIFLYSVMKTMAHIS